VNADLKTDLAAPRHSNGLDQFFSYIKGESHLSILDMGGASQANISFITGLGHRLYTEDYCHLVDAAFTHPNPLAAQSDPRQVKPFLDANLAYPANHFDGVLIWNSLEHLAPLLLAATVDRLYEVTKPRSYLLAFFHADERLRKVPVYSFRISSPKTLLLTPREAKQPAQIFNNRALEKMFQKFESVKFFLTRDLLREVIVKR
jgi:hypothetical protein